MKNFKKLKPSETHLDYYKRWGKLAEPYFKWQFGQFTPYIGKRVADIGCGLGNFVKFFNSTELYLGFELDPELSKIFEEKHKAHNIKLAQCGDITNSAVVQEIKDNKIDSIVCINVLEHIQNDELALRNMIEAVVPGGYVCLLVPAVPCIYGTLDKLDNHHRRYSKKQLLDLLGGSQKQRVEIIKCYYMNFIGVFGWFLKGRILKEKTHGNENYKIMNLILPFISSIESIIKPPIGMSLVMVLKKHVA